MFLNGYRSGFADDPFLREYGITGMAKAIQPSYAYPYRKCREKDTEPSSASDIEDTLKKG